MSEKRIAVMEVKMTKQKKTETKTKKEVRYEYWFAFADRCNKLQNALADTRYLINSRERVLQAQTDIRRITGDNFKAFYNYKLLRKKCITVTGNDDVEKNNG